MTDAIIDTQEMAEMCDFDEDQSPRADLAATAESDPAAKIEFHVQMTSWTLSDMESLIVEAAARTIVGKVDRPTELAKQIENRVREMLIQKADARLDAVTSEIIDQPVTPTYGDKKPVTMREMIGLYGREYLTQVVNSDGNLTTDYYNVKKPRMQWLTERALDAKFKAAITNATAAAISEVQREIRATHETFISEEKARMRAAWAKAMG